jgi:hypothetical protein
MSISIYQLKFNRRVHMFYKSYIFIYVYFSNMPIYPLFLMWFFDSLFMLPGVWVDLFVRGMYDIPLYL